VLTSMSDVGVWNLAVNGCIRTANAMVATATDARNERRILTRHERCAHVRFPGFAA